MFYVKSEIGEGVTLRTEITSENTFTTCSDCGREVAIDLNEAIVDGCIDLYGSGCRCERCSYEHALQYRDEPWAEMLILDFEAAHS